MVKFKSVFFHIFPSKVKVYAILYVYFNKYINIVGGGSVYYQQQQKFTIKTGPQICNKYSVWKLIYM